MKNHHIYVHIPFCASKCGYCDFNSYSGMEPLVEDYLGSLKKEFEKRLPWKGDRTVDSIYFGGGTPSLLPAGKLANLLKFFTKETRLSSDAEITVEANPGSITVEKLKILKDSGVNRLSIGVQSFQDKSLKSLGRIHTKRDAEDAIQWARSAGFRNLSLDLIFGLPGQTVLDWERELQTALKISPEHISAYQLTVEKDTEFGRLADSGQLELPEESAIVEMFQRTSILMVQAGYERYEISNYARGKKYCRHNLNTWGHGEYLGIGAGACSFLDGTRTKNAEGISDYIQNIDLNLPCFVEEEKVDGKRELTEILMLGLRMVKGVDLKGIEERTAIKIEKKYSSLLFELREQDLLRLEEGRMRLTEKGMLFSNEVFLRFM